MVLLWGGGGWAGEMTMDWLFYPDNYLRHGYW